MDINKAETLLENAIMNFHGRFKKMYGQISIRVDGATYLTTGGNKMLSEIGRDEFELCDINSGDLGEIFTRRPDINAIIFCISADTVEASSGVDSVPACLEDIAMLTGPEIQVIGSTSTEAYLDALKSSNICLVKGTGALSVGSNMKKAVAGILILEKACEVINHGRMLGGAIPIPADDAAEFRLNFLNDYVNRNEEEHVQFVGFDEEEFSKRSELIEYGKDLVRRDLAYGSWGNISIRLNEDEMLITPSSIDYFEVGPEDIVRVNLHTMDYGDQRMPSSEALMHAMIYLNRADANAVVHTHSNAISVFSACKAGFAIKDETMHNLVGDMLVCDYAPAGSEDLARAVAETMKSTHACVIPHHGAVFYGPGLDVVFAIAEAVEQKARNLLAFDAIDSFEDVLDD